MEQGFDYSHRTAPSDSKAPHYLVWCNIILGIINLFVSTFFISYIFKFSADTFDYVYNVGLYQAMLYAAVVIVYFISSFIVDRTNRVNVYRFGIFVKLVLVLLFIFYGEVLARHVFIAGILNGVSIGLYYASFNVLKQEMVSKSKMKSFATSLHISSKIVSVVVPVILGTIIDCTGYSFAAILVSVICFIQFLLSFGVKSIRPAGSSYSISGYLKKLKKHPDLLAKLKLIYLACCLFGFLTALSILVNVSIVLEFGSNVSLGILTSVFACVSVAVIFLFNKFSKMGKRNTYFYIFALILCISSIIFSIYVNKFTLIIYNLGYATVSIVIECTLDIHRNSSLKEAGLYSEISEHHTIVEILFSLSRIAAFVIMMLVGLSKKAFAINILIAAFAILSSIILVICAVYEKKYFKHNTEKKL